MSLCSEIRERLRALVYRHREDAELAEEIRFHLEMAAAQHVREGLPEDEARRRAALAFGGVEAVREQWRDARGVRPLEDLVADVRFALRTLRRTPGFTAVAVLTLGLGIGANTAIFTAFDALLLRALPYGDTDRLVAISLAPQSSASKAALVELRTPNPALADVAGYSKWEFALTGRGEAEMLVGALVSANLFDVLGVGARVGGGFVPADGTPAGGQTVVVSDGFWRRHFAADPRAIGRTLVLDGVPRTIVGVMPPGFAFPSQDVALWVPAPIDPAADDYAAAYLTLIGRLRPGATGAQATAVVGAVARRLRAAAPDGYPERFGRDVMVGSLRSALLGDARPMLLLLLAAVALVLLIACANVGNLLLARAGTRHRELALRMALGATRARVVRQMLTESIVLAVLGGGAGLLAAGAGARLLRRALPAALPQVAGIGVDLRVLAFALGLSLAVGVLFGVVPALRASSREVQGALKEGGRQPAVARPRLLETVIVAEIALALVLTTAAGLMLRTIWNLAHQDPGFARAGVLTLRVSLPADRYAAPARIETFYADIIGRIAAMPEVDTVGAIHLLPLGGNNWGSKLHVEGRPLPTDGPAPEVDWRVASPGYFAALGIPLVRGRGFSAQDRSASPPVALINRTAARRYFPGENPVGRRVRTDFEDEGAWATIVGVVGDTRDQNLREPPRPQLYRPHAQVPHGTMTLVVRTTRDPDAQARPIRGAIASVDANVPVSQIQTLSRVASDSIAQPRLLMDLLTAFAVLALALGAVGVYGVMSYVVGQRRHEFGIRRALGAPTGEVFRLVLARTVRVSLAGVGLGLLGSFAIGRALSSRVYGVGAVDPVTSGAVALLLVAVALLAGFVPAVRASRVPPMIALREE